jgi:N-acetylglucosamine-6-sulfatase
MEFLQNESIVGNPIPPFHMNPYHTRLTLLALSALAGLAAHAAELETTQPVAAKTNGEKWWNGNCERIMADIKKMEGEIDVAIVGDSITARWRGSESWTKHWGSYRSVNMGIGGDRTQNVLWRLQNGELDGYKARLFVVMIGTNNLFDKKTEPSDAAAGVKAIIDLIQTKQPQARILLLGIFPRGEKPNPGREKIAATNELIAKYQGGAVHYMDIGAKFLEPDGTISKEVMKDFLHLAPKGYDIWAEAIKDKVKELVGGASSAPKSAVQP